MAWLVHGLHLDVLPQRGEPSKRPCKIVRLMALYVALLLYSSYIVSNPHMSFAL